MRSAPSLSFEPAPSRVAIALILAVALLAIAAIVFSGLPSGGRLGLATLLSILLARTLRVQAAAFRLLCVLQPDGDWLIKGDVVEHRATLRHSHDLGFLIALHFRTDAGRRVDVVLWPDSIPHVQRRQLRVWLGRNGRS